MAEALKVGDTVRQKVLDKPRDPVMTIKTIAGDWAICTWMGDEVAHSDVFRLDHLVREDLRSGFQSSEENAIDRRDQT